MDEFALLAAAAALVTSVISAVFGVAGGMMLSSSLSRTAPSADRFQVIATKAFTQVVGHILKIAYSAWLAREPTLEVDS
jgi:uncharacterized membrane protein YfcA